MSNKGPAGEWSNPDFVAFTLRKLRELENRPFTGLPDLTDKQRAELGLLGCAMHFAAAHFTAFAAWTREEYFGGSITAEPAPEEVDRAMLHSELVRAHLWYSPGCPLEIEEIT